MPEDRMGILYLSCPGFAYYLIQISWGGGQAVPFGVLHFQFVFFVTLLTVLMVFSHVTDLALFWL